MFYRKLSVILFLIMIISGCAEEKRVLDTQKIGIETDNNTYYTITFYGNGGTGIMDVLKVKQGGKCRTSCK